MKTIKQFVLTIFLVAIASHGFANEKIKVKADTVRIKFENVLLEVATFDLKRNTLEKANVVAKINELIKAVENVEIKTPKTGERVIISLTGFVEGEEIDFKKLQLKNAKITDKTIVVKDGKFLETDFGNFVLEMEDADYLVRLYVEKLEDAKAVDSSDFQSKIIAADNEIPENRKKTLGWLIENNSGSFNSYFMGEVPPFTLDQLELNAGVVTGLIHNEFVTGFNFRLGLAFATKGILKHKYFADYELLYDFSDSEQASSFDLNGFLSVGYVRNFSLDPQKANWYGISAGYLVNRGNDFFEKNTFKIAVHKQISNSIILKPEIYFNDFFKNGSPGLRIQIAF